MRFFQAWPLSFAALLFFLIPASAFSQALTVSEAYEKVLRKRIPYITMSSSLPTDLARSFESLFRATDRAVVARVSMLEWCRSMGTTDYSFELYQLEISTIQDDFAKVLLPAEVRPVIGLLNETLNLHQEYFRQWSESVALKREFSEAFRPGRLIPKLVGKANANITEAQKLILQAYPSENDSMKQAIKSHMLALQFP